MGNNWQRKIDSINRKSIIKKRFNKALIPVSRVKDCVVDGITSYIANKRAQRLEREEKQTL